MLQGQDAPLCCPESGAAIRAYRFLAVSTGQLTPEATHANLPAEAEDLS